MINLVEEEEYDEGFKIKSRGILEEDEFKLQNLDIVIENPNNLNPLSKIIYNILASLSFNVNVNLESKYPAMINLLTSLLLNPNIIETQEQYANRKEKSTKKLPPYEFIFNTSLICLTSGIFIIYLQSEIPSFKPKKTFPGCVKSLTGFPINGQGDNSSIEYISCILYNIKTSESPWNVLKKIKVENISEKIIFFY